MPNQNSKYEILIGWQYIRLKLSVIIYNCTANRITGVIFQIVIIISNL